MIKKEIVNGKIFVEQTTFYMYEDEDAHKSDTASLITSDQDDFEMYKEVERERERVK